MRKYIFIMILTGLWAVLSCGCVKKIYVPVENVRVLTDTVMSSGRVSDTVIMRDSVRIEQKGDTVYETRWHTRERTHIRTDTVYRQHTDTVRIKESVPASPGKNRPVSRIKIYVVATGLILACGALIRIFRKNR